MDENINKTSVGQFELSKTSAKMNLSEVFAQRHGSYLNEFTLFNKHESTIQLALKQQYNLTVFPNI